MTAPTMTLTVTLNNDNTLTMDATASKGISLNSIGEGMIRSLESQILAATAAFMNVEDSPEMRKKLAPMVRERVQRIVDAAPTIDQVAPGMSTTIPASMEVSDGE